MGLRDLRANATVRPELRQIDGLRGQCLGNDSTERITILSAICMGRLENRRSLSVPVGLCRRPAPAISRPLKQMADKIVLRSVPIRPTA